MPVVPFVGGTYQMEAVSFDAQRCVNMYVLMSEVGDSKSPIALRSVAGLRSFTTVGDGPIRGSLETNGRAFCVSSDGFYEVFADGTSTLHGELDTLVTLCQMQENPTQIMIIDKSFGYIFTKATNAFQKITDVDFPTPSSLTFQDGYFVVSIAGSSSFAISNLNNGLTWDLADRLAVEGNPDELVAIRSNKSNLWAFGRKTTEVLQNTGAAVFPFSRIGGAFIQTGCASPDTIVNLDNSLIWLGIDENGDSIIWRSNGYSAQRISTQAIERKISESSLFNESYAWSYHERGHAFYVIQVKGLNTTLFYDITTGLWHERTYRDPVTGMEKQHRGANHMFAFNKHLVGARDSNNIYEMSLDFYDDAGDPLVKKRISPHYDQEKRLITHRQFEIDMEVGVGLVSGQGSDPQIMMQYSDDGGNTWSNELWRDIGKIGKKKTRVRWNKLGKTRDRVYSIEVSDPVFIQINEAIVNGI